MAKMKDRMFEIMIAGLTLVLVIQLYTLNSLGGRIDSLESKINARIDALSVNVQDIDRRLARIEGAYSCRQNVLAKDKAE